MNKLEQIREYFKQYGPSSAALCARATGIKTSYVHKKTGELYKRGLLNRLNRGLYEYKQSPDHKIDAVPALQAKMARAIRMCPTFTAWDIAQLSGAALKYANIYIRFLEKSGHVKKSGKKNKKAVYRCAKISEKLPAMTQSRADKAEAKNQELKKVGWQLMRELRDGELNEALRNCRYLRHLISEAISPLY